MRPADMKVFVQDRDNLDYANKMAATGFAYCANDNPIIVNSTALDYCTLEAVPFICFWLLNTKLCIQKK